MSRKNHLFQDKSSDISVKPLGVAASIKGFHPSLSFRSSAAMSAFAAVFLSLIDSMRLNFILTRRIFPVAGCLQLNETYQTLPCVSLGGIYSTYGIGGENNIFFFAQLHEGVIQGKILSRLCPVYIGRMF